MQDIVYFSPQALQICCSNVTLHPTSKILSALAHGPRKFVALI